MSLSSTREWAFNAQSSTRFFAKYTHFAIVFAGSAERGTLLLWNGGWSIRLAALGEELRLPKVEEKCTVPEVLTKAIRYTCTTSLAILHIKIYTHHPHSVSRYANHPTTFLFVSTSLIFLCRSAALENELLINAQRGTEEQKIIFTKRHLKAKIGE